MHAQCTGTTVYRYYSVPVLQCTVTIVYRYYSVPLLQCIGTTVYRYYSVLVLQFTVTTVYRYYSVSVLQSVFFALIDVVGSGCAACMAFPFLIHPCFHYLHSFLFLIWWGACVVQPPVWCSLLP